MTRPYLRRVPAWDMALGCFQRSVLDAVALAGAAKRARAILGHDDPPDAPERAAAVTVAEVTARLAEVGRLPALDHDFSDRLRTAEAQVRRALKSLVARRHLRLYRAPRRGAGSRPLAGTADRYGIDLRPKPDLIDLRPRGRYTPRRILP